MKNSRSNSKPTSTSNRSKVAHRPSPDCPPIAEQIAIAAYFKAQSRGFEPGHELEDWLAAEAEVH